MTGERFIEVVEPILKERGIKKSAFCSAIGVSPNMYANYSKGAEPKSSKIEAAEKYLCIRFSVTQDIYTEVEKKALEKAAEKIEKFM